MEKRDLSEDIAKGIVLAFSKIFILIFISLVLFIILSTVSNKYNDYKQDKCIKAGTCNILTMSYNPCSDNNLLECRILEIDEKIIVCSADDSKNCIPSERIVADIHLCGHQEANAYFENFKSNNLDKNLSYRMECRK